MHFAYAPYHDGITELPDDRNSFVIRTKLLAKSAVVFVHGFTGHARETWGFTSDQGTGWHGFEEGATQSDDFKHVDLFFFGYDGLSSNTLAATSFLYTLLSRVGDHPISLLPQNIAPAYQKNREAGYSRIVVVAHSLGGVVSRWALVRAAEERAAWTQKIRYLLFAPAHRGSDLAKLAEESSRWIKPVVAGIKAKMPLVRELQSDSPILMELESRTRRLLPKNDFLKASKVVIAEDEAVVNNWIFADDPFPLALRGTTHETICKPSSVRPEPLNILKDLL